MHLYVTRELFIREMSEQVPNHFSVKALSELYNHLLDVEIFKKIALALDCEQVASDYGEYAYCDFIGECKGLSEEEIEDRICAVYDDSGQSMVIIKEF